MRLVNWSLGLRHRAAKPFALAREKGQILILAALIMPVLFGMVGIAVDVGMVMSTRTQLQAAVDAAALAGARDLPGAPATARTQAISYANQNKKVGLVPGDVLPTPTVQKTYAANDSLYVSASRPVTTFFVRILPGVIDPTVQASATAINAPVGSVYGVIPWVVNNDAAYTFGALVSLQSVAGSGNGGFNFASITPPGGQTYAEAMANGTTHAIKANVAYPTNTFDGSRISGQTASALNARINAHPTETWNNFATGSSRVVVVPIANGDMPNAPAPITVTTFRAFFLDHVDTIQNQIWGRFVPLNLSLGTIGPGVPDQGVHVIKIIK